MTDCFILPKDQYSIYLDHLKRLTNEDRIMRFWSPICDKSIHQHIVELPDKAVVFAIVEDVKVVGAIEVIRALAGAGESMLNSVFRSRRPIAGTAWPMSCWMRP